MFTLNILQFDCGCTEKIFSGKHWYVTLWQRQRKRNQLRWERPGGVRGWDCFPVLTWTQGHAGLHDKNPFYYLRKEREVSAFSFNTGGFKVLLKVKSLDTLKLQKPIHYIIIGSTASTFTVLYNFAPVTGSQIVHSVAGNTVWSWATLCAEDLSRSGVTANTSWLTIIGWGFEFVEIWAQEISLLTEWSECLRELLTLMHMCITTSKKDKRS